MKTYLPLKSSWKIDEQAGFVPDQIQERVNSEDNYTNCKRYSLVEVEDRIDILCPRLERIN